MKNYVLAPVVVLGCAVFGREARSTNSSSTNPPEWTRGESGRRGGERVGTRFAEQEDELGESWPGTVEEPEPEMYDPPRAYTYEYALNPGRGTGWLGRVRYPSHQRATEPSNVERLRV